MKVILADPISWTQNGVQGGHYRAVAENYAAIFEGRDFVVAGGPIYKSWCDKLLELPCNQSSNFGHWKNKIVALQNCRALFRSTKGASVVLQSAGFATELLGVLLFADKKSKVFLIQYQPLNSRPLFCRILYFLARRKLRGVICPNDEVGRSFGGAYCIVPDYIYVGDGESILDTGDEAQYDFTSVGIQCRDKGSLEFARRIAETEYTLLVAGHASNPAFKRDLETLAANHSNIHLDLRYLTKAEYDKAIASGTYCVLNYTDAYSIHSSGVVYDMLYRGKPIVGRRCSALSVVGETGTGFLYDSLEKFDPVVLFDGRLERYKASVRRYLSHSRVFARQLVDFLECSNSE